MDVVLNKDSKRKVQSVVGWKKDERLFGGEAAAVVSEIPCSHVGERRGGEEHREMMRWRARGRRGRTGQGVFFELSGAQISSRAWDEVEGLHMGRR